MTIYGPSNNNHNNTSNNHNYTHNPMQHNSNNSGNNHHNNNQHNHHHHHHHQTNQTNHSNSNGLHHPHHHPQHHQQQQQQQQPPPPPPAPHHPLMLNTAMMTVAQYHSGLNCNDNSNLSLPSLGGSCNGHLHNQLDIPPEAKPIIQSVSYISNNFSSESGSCPSSPSTSYKTIILTNNGIIENNGLNNFTNTDIIINGSDDNNFDFDNKNFSIISHCFNSEDDNNFITHVHNTSKNNVKKSRQQSSKTQRPKGRQTVIPSITPILQETKLQMLKQRVSLKKFLKLKLGVFLCFVCYLKLNNVSISSVFR